MSSASAIETFEEIGRGEHTIVYRGHDMTLNRQVAVKELTPQARSDARILEQFVKEAQFLAQHQDENILTVYSVDRDRGWIVMELLQGTLATRVQQGPMDPDLVRSVLQQVLRALNFLHKKSKVHGKVRPSNILINDQGRVKLSDFEEIGAKAELRVPTGSKKYLAPELLKSEFGPFGPSLDLYCLGFTALELLKGPNFDMLFPGTGQGAIDADTAWMRWHTSEEEMRPVRELVPGVPDDLATVIDSMLKKHVKDRPQTAQKALDLLRDVPLKKLEVVPSAAAASQTPPVAPPVPRAPQNSGFQPSNQAGAAGSQKPTKQKLNDFLGRPYVLYPLCALILIAALLIGLQMRGNEASAGDDQVAVAIDVEPRDAKITVDGKSPTAESKGDHQGKVLLEQGKHKFAFSKPGYEETTLEVDINDNNAKVGPVRLKKKPAPVDPIVKNDPPKKVDPVTPVTNDKKKKKIDDEPPVPPVVKSRLPEQLVAVEGAEIDPELKLPVRVQVAALADTAPLELVLFKPGTFQYGVEGDRLPGELEAKEATIEAPFYLAATETTNEQFAVFAKSKGETFEDAWQKAWLAESSPANVPVRQVSWQAAQEFSQWAGGELPTEKEWEFAARGPDGKGFPYPWQSDMLDAEHANLFYGTAASKLAAVDELPAGASPQGLMHLLGNVAEWCSDLYEPGEGEASQAEQLKDKHAIRGCSFAKSSDDARVTWRAPEESGGAIDVGFRVLVRIPDQDK